MAVLLPAEDDEFGVETRELSPAHLLVRIESFSLLSKYGIRQYESREFEAGGHKWKLIIHPEGHKSGEDESEYMSVDLAMVGTSSLPVDWEVNAVFNIFLFNQILDNYLCFRGKMRRFHAMKPKWGFSKMISKKSLTDPSNGFLVDDTCVIGAEVFILKSERVIERLSLLKIDDPYRREWKIPEFSKLGEEGFVSETFSVEDHEWKIEVYPNGLDDEDGRSVSIYFELVDAKEYAPHEKVKVDFTMRIKNQTHNDHHTQTGSRWFTCADYGYQLSAFMPIAEVFDPSKGFIVNDCCVFEAEISVQAAVLDEPLSE